MGRLLKDQVDWCFDHHVHLESRTIFLNDGDDTGEIDALVARNFAKAMHLLIHQNKEKPIEIFLNSFGGCWFSGMAIYDIIQSAPCEVNITVMGSAMSMGSIILQAADKRVMYPNATLMLHEGQNSISAEAQTFHNWAKYLDDLRKQMYRIFAKRTGKTVTFWKRKCTGADIILTAKEAKELGLIDSIHGEE